MGELTPSPFNGIPYLPPSQRGPNGYMDRLELDDDSKNAILQARSKCEYILDDETGIYSELNFNVQIPQTSDLLVDGAGCIEITRDDIDGFTPFEDIKSIDFSFKLTKTDFRLGTVYGSYDEYNIVFDEFSLPQLPMQKALLSKIELRIKEKIIAQVRKGHIHANGED